jgi:hypothetical protein
MKADGRLFGKSAFTGLSPASTGMPQAGVIDGDISFTSSIEPAFHGVRLTNRSRRDVHEGRSVVEPLVHPNIFRHCRISTKL